ncbi:hypothetical protein CFOL_v3_00825 [Cephalotus follicularis]|uniref:Uncharacterized protein n=1 Tax=Cephalotus follicularis TaxID=3775 RepID=A0A1Q3ANF8_CEPFO|nr:hypothetical protein CFOL_v3_00825 [Cephalotus follicularis]
MEHLQQQPHREDEEEEEMIWKSESMLTVTIGRVMSSLLSSRPKKLRYSISRLSLHLHSKISSLGSLEDSLWFLHKYVRDAAEKDESLDDILVPMIEHSLKCKESKHGAQPLMLLDWLFQDELLFQALATNLANIISRKDDRYIAFGWCTLVRGLVEYDSVMDHYLVNGIRENYSALLKMLCSSIVHLSRLLCKGSTLQDGFELPSRLSVSAADCLLALTEALTKKSGASNNVPKSLNSSSLNRPITLLPAATVEKKAKSAYKSPKVSNMEMEYILWDHLDELIILAERLLAWSRKSRPLHAKGLGGVLKWLQEIRAQYPCLQDEAGSKVAKTSALLLSSCWKHFSILLRLEDHKFPQHHKELLDQYLSGLQYYTDSHAEGQIENKDGGVESRKFFLTCLCLLLGRFDSKKFEDMISEYGMQISRALLSQLRCADEEVIDGVVCIFKAAIFWPNNSCGSSVTDSRQMDAVLPLLLPFLDERDGMARAVVMLISEYCSKSTSDHCLQEVLKRLASGNVFQRRNAIDVISELIHVSSISADVLSPLAWKDISNNLLERLGDEELVIREQISNLLPMIDPSLVLPALVRLVYSSDEKVRSCANDALIGMLKHHNSKVEVISMLLDCISNLSQSLDLPETTGHIAEGPKFDSDRVFRLIPEWSKHVSNWSSLIGPLIDKMFAEPSNAIIVRFLSVISEHLTEAADLVLHRVLLQMKGQEEIDESIFYRWDSGTNTSDNSMKMQLCLFERLCPLLIIRMLPLRVFNDLNSSMMYGQLLDKGIMHDYRDIVIIDRESVSAILLNRALSKFEFEDVRKLAAELCGRIHPKVLLPIVYYQLKDAAGSQDILKIKACLFSVCTSLVVRGNDSVLYPVMLGIRKLLEIILLWPSSDGDEVSKAQHGCIDCLALMICAELQIPKSLDATSKKTNFVVKDSDPGNAASRNSVLSYVIHQLVNNKNELSSASKLGADSFAFEVPVPVPFRLCMANVLISICQKISDSSRRNFAQKTLPLLVSSIEAEVNPQIRAACVEVLFSAVYHLKSAVIPYSSDLLGLSLNFLRKASEKERIAGAKLMASLMASEDTILESISGGLLEARSVLSSVSSTDTSINLRQMCEKLLACMTYP